MNISNNRRIVNKQSLKFIHNRRKRMWWIFLLVIVIIVSWLFVISRLTHIGVFTINDIEVSGTDARTSAELVAVAYQAIGGEYLGLFSKSNSFIYPKSSIKDIVKNTSAKVLDVNVKRNGLHKILLTIKEKIPFATICANLPNLMTEPSPKDELDSCFFSDMDGYIFDIATSTDTMKNLSKYYIPFLFEDKKINVIGSYIPRSIPFASLKEFIETSKSSGIDAKGVLVKEEGEYELYAKNRIGNNISSTASTIVIYFNEENGLDNQLSNLISFWKRIFNSPNSSEGTIRFDSIDLRYGSNVFWREVK
ncbi:MAG: hypothetical protein WCW03_00235 [Candidatus Paceibacterota bacterium]|jgi:hypothetical protein